MTISAENMRSTRVVIYIYTYVGTQIICERSENFFCTPRFVQLLLKPFWGIKADPPDKF